MIIGQPVFGDTRLARLAREQGAEAAWREAWRTLGAEGAARAAQGDFAVGLHGEDGRVFLAVDRFAERTLCWRIVDGVLRWADRADALGATAIDPQAIFDYLFFHCIPSPRTIFTDVFRLPPGHCAVLDRGRVQLAPYWTPEFVEPPSASFDSLRDEFREYLQAAVASRLDGTKPACFLSGGTDSSTVAGMIGRVAGIPASTYSIGFDAQGYDEMNYARIAARHFKTDHHEYYVTPADLVRSIPAVAASFDQPFGNSSALPAYFCARMAREDGVTRLLAGDGGDELFGGNSRYAKQRVFGWYDAVPMMLRKNLLEPVFESPLVGRLPLLKKGRSYVEQAKVPMPDRLQMYNLLIRLGVDEVLETDFLSQVDVLGPARHQRAVWSAVRNASALNRTLAFDWRYTLGESDLPKVRSACGLAGTAVAFPMLDQALLDFSLRLPTAYKLKGLKLRWFFKGALRGFLPDEILAKRKQGFGLPFGVWLTRDAALQRLAQESLDALATRRIVRPAFLRSLMRERLSEHPGYYGEMVWILMMLEQWMRRAG